MERCRLILIFLLNFVIFGQSTNNIAYNIPDPECTGVFNLCTDADKERLGRLAIKAIHEQMDDDKDGKIEASESSDFIKEELESKSDADRHRHFQNADLQITFEDLWNQWKSSSVYNWTTDQVIDWLVNHVHLPMYVENFRRNQIDGRMIPRIAVNEKHYLSSIMQLRDPRHKRRLVIKSMDIILFGPPKHTHNLLKDVILMSALFISIIICLYAFVRHRKTQESMKLMLKDLETLQQAEGDLIAVTGKMKAMENELKDKVKVDRGLLNSWFVEVQKTKEEADRFRKRRDSTTDLDKQYRLAVQETEQLRIALRKAEEHARHQSFEAPAALIDLLRRTYHIEQEAFEIKRKSAENSMLAAKEQMNKISKMQRGFFGAVRIAHTGCMDTISELINAAKANLAAVQDEFEERENRWNRIASLLDREDLISNSSSSTTSTLTNHHVPTVVNGIANNGILNQFSGVTSYGRNSQFRPKQISTDPNNILNINNDSPKLNKRNSHINQRTYLVNSHQGAMATFQEELNGKESSPDRSAKLRRRTVLESISQGDRSSDDTSNYYSSMIHSSSANQITSTNTNSTNLVTSQTVQCFDTTSNHKTDAPMFDISSDLQSEMTDLVNDEFEGRTSQLSAPSSEEQKSISSSEKIRKSFRGTKLFKSFSNLRLRKKTNTT